MTVRLTDESPMRVHAARFGAQLVRAMDRRGVGQNVVREAAGVSRASVVEFRHGRNLPTVPVARRLSEALGDPLLLTIVVTARTRHCSVCSKPFIQDTGRPRLYCSCPCRTVGAARGTPTGSTDGLNLLKQELLRVGPIRKQTVGKAITLIEDARAPEIAALQALAVSQGAVHEMCRTCEPEGYCRNVECPLREVSPLPLAGEDPDVSVASRPPGRWGTQERRDQWSEQMRQRHAERPEWAAGTAQRARDRWAAMTDEERAEFGQKVSAGRRRASE